MRYRKAEHVISEYIMFRANGSADLSKKKMKISTKYINVVLKMSTNKMVTLATLVMCSNPIATQTATNTQRYPLRPVRMIVPNLTGSATNIITRTISQRLSET